MVSVVTWIECVRRADPRRKTTAAIKHPVMAMTSSAPTMVVLSHTRLVVGGPIGMRLIFKKL